MEGNKKQNLSAKTKTVYFEKEIALAKRERESKNRHMSKFSCQQI